MTRLRDRAEQAEDRAEQAEERAERESATRRAAEEDRQRFLKRNQEMEAEIEQLRARLREQE